MAITGVHAGSIAVGVDGSDSSTLAVTFAVEQASTEQRPLTLVHAIEPMAGTWITRAGYDARDGVGTMLTQARALMSATRAAVSRQDPALEVHEVLRMADPRQLLLEVGQRASLLVVGSHGRGPIRSLMLGSVGVALVRHADFPLVVVRPRVHAPRGGILVGVDGTERCAEAVEFAFRQASQHGLPLTVLHAYWDVRHAVTVDEHGAPYPDVSESLLVLAESIAGMRERYPDVRVQTELGRGLPDLFLISKAERMDLLVVGAHHVGVAAELRSASVASSVVERAHCPVAVIPAHAGH